ncbi:MAG TPA: SDR family NAD(P)-dependent oxidoreductase [Planctomycetaceae bacterium]|nr:SDR family NAD(P)-dependent oxidoreductase [Planctomycetaceae bacterium]
MRLANRTAVITGGGSGIGAAIAHAFSAEGARVLIAGRGEARLKEAAAKGSGPHPISFQISDVASRSDIEQLFAAADRLLGRVDILVNSAGINVPRRALSEISPEDWQQILDVNATGTFLCVRAVLPQMRARRDGLIVNISSVAGIRASLLGGAAYTASKFAASGFGLVAGLEEKDHGVRVTNIYPGEVETPILDQRPVPVTAEHRARILQPEDVAAAVLMVALLPPRAHVPELTIKPTTQAFA